MELGGQALVEEINQVLLHFQRMQTGFHQALHGAKEAVSSGRVPVDRLVSIEPRLKAGALSYARAEYRLSGPCSRAARDFTTP